MGLGLQSSIHDHLLGDDKEAICLQTSIMPTLGGYPCDAAGDFCRSVHEMGPISNLRGLQ